MRIIIDTNVLVSGILAKKYEGVGASTDDVIERLIMSSKLYDVLPLPASVCRDPNDDMFIACALSANVKTIISGDAELLKTSGYQGIRVMKPREFCDFYLSHL